MFFDAPEVEFFGRIFAKIANCSKNLFDTVNGFHFVWFSFHFRHRLLIFVMRKIKETFGKNAEWAKEKCQIKRQNILIELFASCQAKSAWDDEIESQKWENEWKRFIAQFQRAVGDTFVFCHLFSSDKR